MIQDYDRESRKLEPDYNEPAPDTGRLVGSYGDSLDPNDGEEPPYDYSKPISIFNHPPFQSMSLREFDEWNRSWL